ncbi:hypothetical protein C8Q79DRAFT_914436 [Trametes meyenii]|nr:hypothetical protein C8Q79DRAFT_914436 [Trametes meyenii]
MSQTSIIRSPATTISSLSSSGSEDNRTHVLPYLPPASKVLAAAPARIYHAAFSTSPEAWTSTGLRGTLVFGRTRSASMATRDRAIGSGEGTNAEHDYWFRLVDADPGKGIVWFHQIPSSFDYRADKPFFHVFSGCSRMFGLRFDEDADAEKFMKRVMSRIQITATRPSTKPRTPKSHSFPPSVLTTASRSPASAPRRVSPSMIAGPSPGTFMHIAHVGVDDDGRIAASPNVEPGWTFLLEELQGFGVSVGADEKMGPHELDFVEGFLAGAKANLVHELGALPPSPTVARGNAGVASSGNGKREGGAHWAVCASSNSPGVSGGRKGRFIPRRRAPVA